jgi:hypothetical protein
MIRRFLAPASDPFLANWPSPVMAITLTKHRKTLNVQYYYEGDGENASHAAKSPLCAKLEK